MTSTVFLRRSAILTISIVGVFLLTNIYIDIYGLFWGRKDRKVYTNERTSKYLLSFRYIPENYDGFIIGPSLSANLDPTQITNYKIYNASIMGANISDLHYLIKNMVNKGKMKVAIICLDPYLTKEFGRKSATIDPKEYYGALGSVNLIKTYSMYVVRSSNLFQSTFRPTMADANGWNRFDLEIKNPNPQKAIEEKVNSNFIEQIKIDPNAYMELKEVIAELKAKNIKVVAYFTCKPYGIYLVGKKYYNEFENQMLKLFDSNDLMINLNDARYKYITSDYASFVDHGHLSAKGQAFVLGAIDSLIHVNNQNQK